MNDPKSSKDHDPPQPQSSTSLPKIEIDEETAHGTFCNLVMPIRTECGIIIDCIMVQPNFVGNVIATPYSARVRARIIVNDRAAKALSTALINLLKEQEKQWGEIRMQPQPTPDSAAKEVS